MPDDAKLPQSVESEEACLGALLIDRDAILLVRDKLQPTDFYRERNGQIYKAIADMSWVRVPADFVTLTDELTRRGTLEECGGRDYLSSLLVNVPNASNVEYYADVVKLHAVRRRIICAAGRMAQIAYSSKDADCENVIAAADAEFAEIRATSTRQGNSIVGSDLIGLVMQKQDEYSKMLHERGIGYPDTPWSALNDLIYNLRPGNLVIVGAPTGHGKTIFVECIAEHNARRGFKTMFFHLELDEEEMGRRQTCRIGQTIAMNQYHVDSVDRNELANLGQMVYDWPGSVRYKYCPGVNASWIASMIRKEAALRRVDLFIIDYLNLIAAENPNDDPNDEASLARNTGIIKTAAAQARVSVILVAQLSNKYAERSDNGKGPRLVNTDIRGSGQISHKSNCTILLWNEGANAHDETISIVDVFVGKNTFGQGGRIQLRWNRQKYSFENLKERDERGL